MACVQRQADASMHACKLSGCHTHAGMAAPRAPLEPQQGPVWAQVLQHVVHNGRRLCARSRVADLGAEGLQLEPLRLVAGAAFALRQSG